jgi:hypothetical protein
MIRWWYAYLPLLYAGSGGKTFVGKFQATEEEVREAFGTCARIEPNGCIHFYKRPPKMKGV